MQSETRKDVQMSSVRKDRMAGVTDAFNNPAECTGVDGLAAKLFRLIAFDAMNDQNMTPAQLNQRMRSFALLLTKDPSRRSNAQQEFSNLLSAWVNPTMPLPRVVQGMGVFGATEVELSMTVKFKGNETITRTLSVPVTLRIDNEVADGVEYSIPVEAHDNAFKGQPVDANTDSETT